LSSAIEMAVSPQDVPDSRSIVERANVVQAEAVAVVGACVIGAGIALIGFPPLNDIAALLHVDTLPGFAVLTPAVLVAALTVWISRRRPTAGTVPIVAVLVIALICLGGCLSLTATPQINSSMALLALGVVAPGCVFLAVRRGGIPPAVLAGSFLAGLTAVLAWADLVFLWDNGLPTPTKLFDAKFTSHAHDFHYYTLGNPDHTATFLLLPLTLGLIWLQDRGLSRRARGLLVAAAAVLLFTLLLLYVRLPMIVGFALLLVAVLRSGLPHRLRVAILVAALGGAAWMVVASPADYFAHLFSTSRSSSGGVRLGSISDGLRVLGHHLLTGVGLGQYGSTTGVPAHSSVVQAGAELGLTGLLGLLLMTIALPVIAIVHCRGRRTPVLAKAALAGAAVYVLAAAVSAGADDGLFVGLVPVYGLTLALFAGIGLTDDPAPMRLPLVTALGLTREAVGTWLTRWVRQWARRPRLAWIGYGLVWTPIAAAFASWRLPRGLVLSSSRVQELNGLIAAHHHGFGPLVEMLGPNYFYPSGPTDDPGAYLVTPWLSDLLRTSSVSTIVRTFFLFGLCAIVASYPLAIRRLTGSRLAALVSPLLALLFFSFMTDDGFYWFPAATLAICLPWLLIFIRERTAPAIALMVIAAAGGVTQLFRAQTGLGLLLGAVVVCLLVSAPRRRRAAAIALVTLAYITFSTGVLGLALQARASRMHSYPLTTNGYAGLTKWSDGGGHPFWHTVYIGLGVVHNRYGITYNDSVAAAYVRSVDAAAPFVSPEYESILRKRVLHLVISDPGFVLRAEKRKVGDVLADGLQRFWPLLLVSPLAVLMGVGRGRRRRYAAVLLPVAAIAILPPLIAVPDLDYEFPWLGLLATTSVLSVCWLLRWMGAWAADSSSALLEHPSGEPLRAAVAGFKRGSAAATAMIERTEAAVCSQLVAASRFLWRTARATVACGAALGAILRAPAYQRRLLTLVRSRSFCAVVAVGIVGFAARTYLDNWQANVKSASTLSTPGAGALPFDAALPTRVSEWRLSALPAGWTTEPGTRLQTGTMLRVSTTTRNNSYQLQSPVVLLPPGTYVAAIRGELRSGGMTLGVLDVRADKWIQVAPYQSSAPATRATMTDDFHLTKREKVQIILSDLSTSGTPSEWLLNEALIARQKRTPFSIPLRLPPPLPAVSGAARPSVRTTSQATAGT
jgi:hypothetical protein